MMEIELDLQRHEQVKEYAHQSRRLMVLDLLVSVVYMLAWVIIGWEVGLRSWLRLTPNPWLLVMAFAAVFGVLLVLIGLPLSYF